jgi:hypothetical protein
MFKLGICSPQDLGHALTTFGKRRQISYSLLKTPSPAAAEDIKRFETVIRRVCLSSGVSRTTYRSRFDDVEAVTQEVLLHTFRADRALNVHDLGASDGLLSMQWAQRLFAAFPRARMTASDTILYFTEAALVSSGATYILEPNGTPIQYTKAPFVVWLPRREHPLYLLNTLMRAWARWQLKRQGLCDEPVSWQGVPDGAVINRGGWRFRQIPLVHPDVLAFACIGRFQIVEADAFCSLPSQCDVIRSMNLFQPAVFSDAKIRKGIRAAIESIVEGGVFVVGRTMESDGCRNDVSIFQKSRGRVRVVERLGKGFEFEQLALEISL